nr:hypothetical protein [uncultured Campylobacter sp.]
MRFLIFIFAFLFIAAIFFVRDEILSKRAKIIATALIVLLCAGAYFYESASERSAKLEEEMVFKFNAGARLRCGGAINSASETRGSDAKNLSSQADEANLKEQDKTASAAQSSAALTNEQASTAQSSSPQTSDAVSSGQNSAQSPTSQNSTGQSDTQNHTQQNSAQRGDTQTYSPQASAQIVTRESFTYSFSMGAFIAKKSAGAEFKGKTYKIKECVYDQ